MTHGTDLHADRRTAAAHSLFNLPNTLTSVRLGLSFVLFATIWGHLWLTSLALFAVAAFTDWLDGYYARRRNLASSLGRVYDPLVDKIMTGGVFVFFLQSHPAGLPGGSGLLAWMVTLVIAREFLVTGIRGHLEGMGVQFGADMFGKWKTVLQIAVTLYLLALFAAWEHGLAAAWTLHLRTALVYAMVLATVFSGLNYVRRALVHLT